MSTIYPPPVVRHEWRFANTSYRLTEAEDFNPSGPEYVIEAFNVGTKRWSPIDAGVLEIGKLIFELLERRKR